MSRCCEREAIERYHPTMARLVVTRSQILAFRRHVGALEERLPSTRRSLRRAAWAGLQDSMPRAALLSIHARVEGTEAGAWEDSSLVQVWGPRFSVYVVAAQDAALFTVGRYPDDPTGQERAEDLAARLSAFLGDRRMSYSDVGKAMGEDPNRLRYATTTGTVILRWEGARRPVIWTVPRPDIEPRRARLELARRYLHVFGPTTPESFAKWAGIDAKAGEAAFEALRRSLVPVVTPIGESWILADDEDLLAASPDIGAPARLLPSGDPYYLLWGDDRELLVTDSDRRAELWTSRVWPGAVLVDGQIVGTWRRSQAIVTIDAWTSLTAGVREAVEAEALSMPLPGIESGIKVRWST